MKVGDYIKKKNGRIGKILEINERVGYDSYLLDIKNSNFDVRCDDIHIEKSSSSIFDLLKPMDLMYIDIDNGYEGGIVVPRIAETQAELDEYIEKFKNGTLILKGVITKKQLNHNTYWLGE